MTALRKLSGGSSPAEAVDAVPPTERAARPSQSRRMPTGRARAAVRMVRAILELHRRGLQDALSGRCPYLVTDWAGFFERNQKRFQETPTRQLLATLEHAWEILCRRTRRRYPRPPYSLDGLAVLLLIENIGELERRGLRRSVSGAYPLLGADIARQQKAVARASTEELLDLVQREWEKAR
jgi:hypothetical protein